MSALLPADGLYRLGIVVEDHRRSMEEFSMFFGMSTWEVHRCDLRRLSRAALRGRSAEYSYICALGSANGVAVELIQPLAGESVFSEFLKQRGEGMHHLHTNVCSVEAFAALRRQLEMHGVGIIQSSTLDGVVEQHLLDTRDRLAGPLIQVTCQPAGCASTKLRPDEIVHFGEEVTRWNRLSIQGIYHACIVTHKRRAQVRDSLQQILGISKWFDFSNETGVSAVETTLYGKPCQIAFDLSLGRRGTLCLEVVEEVYGRSIYSEFLEQKGEGLQHLMTTICSQQSFEEVREWLEAAGMPIIMGGHAASRDFCYYGYIDTRSRLAGITIEFLLPAGPDWLRGREDAGEILVGPR